MTLLPALCICYWNSLSVRSFVSIITSWFPNSRSRVKFRFVWLIPWLVLVLLFAMFALGDRIFPESRRWVRGNGDPSTQWFIKKDGVQFNARDYTDDPTPGKLAWLCSKSSARGLVFWGTSNFVCTHSCVIEQMRNDARLGLEHWIVWSQRWRPITMRDVWWDAGIARVLLMRWKLIRLVILQT